MPTPPDVDDYRWLISDAAGGFLQFAAASAAPLVALTKSLRRDLSAARAHLVLEQAALRRRALTVWLRADAEDHWNRVVQQGDRRPMADNPEAMAELRRLLAERQPLYAEADHVIDTSRLGIDDAAARIEALVRAD